MSNTAKRFILGVGIGLIMGAIICDLRYSLQLKKGVVTSGGIYYKAEVHTDTNDLYEKIRTE
jgi:hypothetical protein